MTTTPAPPTVEERAAEVLAGELKLAAFSLADSVVESATSPTALLMQWCEQVAAAQVAALTEAGLL